MKIIVLNGPPGSGKGEIQKYLQTTYRCTPMSFKTPLVDTTKSLYGISDQMWDKWYKPVLKETPRTELDGLSCREALIKVSEEIIKPHYGKDFFGKRMVQRIKNTNYMDQQVFVIDDGGFNEELEPLMMEFGRMSLYLTQVYRNDCDFSSDSRGWLAPSMFKRTAHIHNNSNLKDLQERIAKVYNEIVYGNTAGTYKI